MVGDSGYAPEPWLLTPITNTVRGTPEARYTETHCSARNVIERVPFDEHEAVAEQNIALDNENVGGIVANDGRRVRAAIVERYFNH
uniref:DDE Tnp4 domain-containing protein n=2 Tax=Timema TaxID=61471 RepID=A0A7R9G8K8_TIMSH|nr:unnamed protein product [Timema shepardi]